MTRQTRLRDYFLPVLAMVAVVAASNILVQFPVQVHLGPLNLADFLTWGAFTYPVAFLVTDLTNRRLGSFTARRVVLAGFLVGIVVSAFLASPRVATASCTAFLIGQLLDIAIFSKLRRGPWWQGPLAAPLLGSAIDTLIFFSLAFSPVFAGLDQLFGHPDGSLAFPAPFFGIGALVPLWISLAAGDFSVKFLAAGVLLAPYRALMGPLVQPQAA
ncbi:MAG TPA: VUT family protein [Devosiaceae bacterium]|nr:VUT family protein [Devosiaceae bacterium]